MDDLTLNEIFLLNDKTLYERYLKELENFKTNRIARQITKKLFGESIETIAKTIIEEEQKNISMDMDFFIGDLVLLHESIKEHHTKTGIICDFSANLIKS